MRSRLIDALKVYRKKDLKSDKTMNLIGCTVFYLIDHITGLFKDGMSWNNYGKWQIDHIKPCNSFNLLDPEEQKMCFHYTNLQPLWREDNAKKHTMESL